MKKNSDKEKIKKQIKVYQEKIKEFKRLLAMTPAKETVTKKLTDAIEKGGKDIHEVVKKGIVSQKNRKKDPNVIKTWTEPPRV